MTVSKIIEAFNRLPFLVQTKRVSLTRFLVQRSSSTSTIDLYTQMKRLNSAKEFRQSISLFDDHRKNRMKITNGAICQALDACIATNDIQKGQRIHQELSAQSMENSFILIYLIRLYMKSGDVRQAKDIFFASKTKTIGMLDAVLNGLSLNDRPGEAMDLFESMSMSPSAFTYAILFKICTQIGSKRSYQYGKMMFEKLPDSHRQNHVILTSALRLFMKSGDAATAEQIFSQTKKDLHALSVMMSGYLANNRPQHAVDLFHQIDKPDHVNYFVFFNACAQLATKEALTLGKKVFSQMPKEYFQLNGRNKIVYALLNMFVQFDDEKDAEALFHQVKKDVMSYGTMMKMYNDKEKPEKVLLLRERMQIERIQPDKVIHLMMINAHAQLGDLSLCESMVSQIPEHLFNEIYIQNGLVDMWGKAGSADRAKNVYDKIMRPDIVSFSAMINSYGLNGMGSPAVELFYQVPKHLLDEWIYVCVLNACSHSGLINEARKIFENIPENKKTEQISTVMVDVLSRSYSLEEAQKLVDQFERNHRPVYPMYMAMLSAARSDRNVTLAKSVFDRIQNYFPENKDCLTSAAVLLANTYALSGDMSTASSIRMKLCQTGMKRKGGISSTVHSGNIVQFRAHDQSHPQSSEIYAELDRLNCELTKLGYVPDSSWSTRPPMNDETEESLLCGHSERLAIAFQLIQKPTPTRIQVTKNLRVCGDCHQTIKLIAQICRCLIIIRDANRVHHFHSNGECSCEGHF